MLHRLMETRVDDTDKASGGMLRPKARRVAAGREEYEESVGDKPGYAHT